MSKEITTCAFPDSVEAYRCITEEQCDDCFMKDHLKECEWCEHYDHPSRKLKVDLAACDYPSDEASLPDIIAEQEYKWGDERTTNA